MMVSVRTALNIMGCVSGLVLTLSSCDGRTELTSVQPEPTTSVLARFAGAVPIVDSVEAILVVNSQVSRVSKVAYASGARIGLGNVAHGASYYVTVRGIKAGGISRWWAKSALTTAALSTESASLQVVQGPQAPSAVYDSLTVPSHITLPAGVMYTVDGSDPRASTTAQLASSTIAVTSARTIFAAISSPAQAATGQPLLWSDLGSWTFVAGGAVGTVAQPIFTPSTGSYNGAQSVSLSSTTGGANIYYTTNGDQPSTASTWYSGSTIPVSVTTTIKALAIKSGMNPSSVAAATFTITTAPTGTTFTDTRDGQVYNMVTIGSQTWMAQNLNYTPASGNSWCYGGLSVNCTTYGRLYDWSTAMGIASSFNRNTWAGTLPRQGVCPGGWHVPSDAEWGTLVTTVEANSNVGAGNAGTALKAGTLWRSGYEGTDRFGFGVLPSGYYAGGTYTKQGLATYFCSATEYLDLNIWYRGFTDVSDDVLHMYDYLGSKTNGLPVRCIAN